MNAHGLNNVVLEGRVVHSYPFYPSNIEGTRANQERIEEAAAGLDRWALWGDLDESFGLTPAAMEQVKDWVLTLPAKGCVAMAWTLAMPHFAYYADRIAEVIAVPFLSSADREEVRRFLEEALAGTAD